MNQRRTVTIKNTSKMNSWLGQVILVAKSFQDGITDLRNKTIHKPAECLQRFFVWIHGEVISY